MDIEKLDLKTLTGLLRPGQITAIAAFLVTLTTGAFGFGFWMGESLEATAHSATKLAVQRAEDDAARAKSEIEALTAAAEDMRGDAAFLQTKLRLLELLTLWHQTRQEVERTPPDDQETFSAAIDKFDAVSENLVQFVLQGVERSEAGTAEPALRARLGKGVAPTMYFEKDQTAYRLPPELFSARE